MLLQGFFFFQHYWNQIFFFLAIYFYTHLPEPYPISLKSGRIFPLTSPALEADQACAPFCAILCFLLTVGRQSWRTNLPQPAPESFDSWMWWRHRKLRRGKMWVYIFPVNHWNWCVFPFLISGHGSRKRTEWSVYSSIFFPLYKVKQIQSLYLLEMK